MTSTVSVTAPTCSARSTRWRALTLTVTSFATALEKPGRLGGDAVCADLHIGKGVVAVLAGDRRGFDSGSLVFQDDGRPGNYGSRTIANRAQDLGGIELREKWGNSQEKRELAEFHCQQDIAELSTSDNTSRDFAGRPPRTSHSPAPPLCRRHSCLPRRDTGARERQAHLKRRPAGYRIDSHFAAVLLHDTVDGVEA